MAALDTAVDSQLRCAMRYLDRMHEFVSGFGARSAFPLAVASKRRSTTTRIVHPLDAPPMWARIGRDETDLQVLQQVWAERCYDLSAVADPRVIVDIGANAGYTTRWFAETFPTAAIIAIEPSADNAQLLRRNTEHLSNVSVVEAAIADHTGELELVDVGGGPWGMRAGPAGEGAGTVVGRVPCISMPDLIDAHSLTRIDYLKIDIEGGEIELFADAAGWIHRVGAIAIELHDRFRPGCSRAFFRATQAFPNERAHGHEHFVWR